MAGRRELVVRAADGRRLCAELSGPAEGALVVFHMGTPGSRRLWEKHVEEGARRGLRHVCCSRPGYEGSDRRPGRSFADCAADTAAVADELGVEEFYVVGGSTGGDYALACAALLPQRVISAAALAGFAPRLAAGLDWTAGMDDLNLQEFEALRAGEEALRRYIEASVEGYGRIRSAAHLVSEMQGALCEPDRDVLAGSFLDFQLRGCRRVAQNGVWGWFDDDHAIWGEWGFDPARIEVPVSIWHGGQDRFVPPAHGEWLGANVPAARLHLLPDEGHLSLWARHYGAVLDELIAA